MIRNIWYPIALLILIIITSSCDNSNQGSSSSDLDSPSSPQDTNSLNTRKSDGSTLMTKELVFTSGAASEQGRQGVPFQVDAPGQYLILLENAQPDRSGYWLVWDYISLNMNGQPIWEIGEDETPPDFSPTAFSEFCDPQTGGSCSDEFVVGESAVGQFSKDLNDGRFSSAGIYFTLTDQQIETELELVLSTLYATHDDAGQFNMDVTLIKIVE